MLKNLAKVVSILLILTFLTITAASVLAAPSLQAEPTQSATGAATVTATATITAAATMTATSSVTTAETMTQTTVVTTAETMTHTTAITTAHTMTHTTAITPVATKAPMAATTGVSGTMAVACEQNHNVQADDTLSKLAEKFFGSISSYQAIVHATNAAAATDKSYTMISNPNRIDVGWKLCIPSAADAKKLLAGGTTAAPAAGTTPVAGATSVAKMMTGTLAIPEGKAVLIFENLSAYDLVVDLIGPTTPAAQTVPPSNKQEYTVEPGSYKYNAHSPGGQFSVAPGTVDIAKGQAWAIVCATANCIVEPRGIMTSTAAMTPAATAMPVATPRVTGTMTSTTPMTHTGMVSSAQGTTTTTTAKPTGTVTPTGAVTSTGVATTTQSSIPTGKGQLVFTNNTGSDFVVDIIGPTNMTVTIPPNSKKEFDLNIGGYKVNGHSPNGEFVMKTAEFDLAEGKVVQLDLS